VPDKRRSNDDFEFAFEFIDHYGFPPRAERPESERVDWPESRLPTAGSTILVMDGLATRSRRGGLRPPPLFEEYRSALAKQGKEEKLTGYSFFEPGLHYEEFDTVLPIEALATQTAQWYMPTSNLQVAYVAFSLAAPVLALSLGGWSLTRRFGSAQPVVFVQPAFAVYRTVLQRWYASGLRVPPAVDQLARAPQRHQNRILLAVDQMRESPAAGPMHLLYWPGDRFIEYPDWLLQRLENLDVTVTPVLDLAFPPKIREGFAQHCYVARHPKMVDRVLKIILPTM
jgi:hypothetical protein